MKKTGLELVIPTASDILRREYPQCSELERIYMSELIIKQAPSIAELFSKLCDALISLTNKIVEGICNLAKKICDVFKGIDNAIEKVKEEPFNKQNTKQKKWNARVERKRRMQKANIQIAPLVSYKTVYRNRSNL